MKFPPKWHIAGGNTSVFGTLLFLWPFNDPGWRPRRLTPQGLKDIFCRLKLFAGRRTGTTHQKHWTHCNKGHFTCCCFGGDDTQKESLCSSAAAATYTNPAAFLDRRAVASGERVEVPIEGLAKGIERQVWIEQWQDGQRGKVSAA